MLFACCDKTAFLCKLSETAIDVICSVFQAPSKASPDKKETTPSKKRTRNTRQSGGKPKRRRIVELDSGEEDSGIVLQDVALRRIRETLMCMFFWIEKRAFNVAMYINSYELNLFSLFHKVFSPFKLNWICCCDFLVLHSNICEKISFKLLVMMDTTRLCT